MANGYRSRQYLGRMWDGQIRAERRLPPGPPLVTAREPWYIRLVVWLFGAA